MPKTRTRILALSAAYIETVHDFLVSELMPGDEPVGSSEYRNKNLIESAVARPFQSAFGEDIYKTTIEKAAVLFHSLISNHPFHNGNKRTAVLALEQFLLVNSWFLVLNDHFELYELAKETASYREQDISHEEILKHIVQQLKKSTISFRRIKATPGTRNLYKILLVLRLGVRNHPLNREQPGRD